MKDFIKGLKGGIPIGLGYLSVSFGFGIMAVRLGIGVLETIIISKNVVKINSFAFSGCTNLKTINYTGTKEEWEKIKSSDIFPSFEAFAEFFSATVTQSDTMKGIQDFLPESYKFFLEMLGAAV